MFPAWPAVIYYAPWYEPYPFSREAAVTPAPAPVEQPTPTGRLILDPQPEGAQVFVDGYYAGIPDDFSVVHGGGVVEGGQHRIEVSAPGYESLSIDVRIAANQSVTYRGALKRIPPPTAKNAPVTFYLIPGCYMGNVPPKDARLPATCDLGRVVEFKY
jgi:PEGA domain-containing protein